MAIQEQEDANEAVPTHVYNLRKRPTKRKEWVSMTQTGCITGVKGHNLSETTCTHHTNKNECKARFDQIWGKGNSAIRKELCQLHETNALMPI